MLSCNLVLHAWNTHKNMEYTYIKRKDRRELPCIKAIPDYSILLTVQIGQVD